MCFRESAVLAPGNRLTVVDTGPHVRRCEPRAARRLSAVARRTAYGKVGLAICYDLRFPEMAQLMAHAGCWLLCYPGAFNMTTGPLHWEALLRARSARRVPPPRSCRCRRGDEGGRERRMIGDARMHCGCCGH